MHNPTVLDVVGTTGGKATVEMQRPRVHRWTVDEYARAATTGVFDGRHVELIDGELLEIEVTQSPGHNLAINLLAAHLSGRPGTHVRVQQAITIPADGEPEPDVALVRGTASDYAVHHPTTAVLVIEVSGDSLRIDQTSKAALYAKAGIPTYWIIDLVHRVVEVRTDPAGDHYATLVTLKPGDTLDGLPLATLFAQPDTPPPTS
jgi:Uma2 family endonuclease